MRQAVLVVVRPRRNPNILFATKRFSEIGLKARQELVKKSLHRESLLDGVHIFLNPNAEVPLPSSMLGWPDVMYHELGEEGIPVSETSDGALFWRMVLTLDPKKDYEEQIREFNEAVQKEIDEEAPNSPFDAG